jgi:choice-of-anchor B domain-containing protein
VPVRFDHLEEVILVFRQTLSAAAIAVALLPGVAPDAALAQPATRNFIFKAQKNDYPPAPGGQNYSACWSYVHSDGREYATIGVNGVGAGPRGTAIYNVTDPAAPYLVGLIPGPPSIWREMKSYRDWIYVVSEGGGTGYGLQIIRMTDPESPVLAATYTTNFITSHTVSVDTTRGLLICNGTRAATGDWTGIRILALNNPGIGATPETPVEVSTWPGVFPVPNDQYVHDSVPIGDRLYAACIYGGVERVLDIGDPAAPAEIASWGYPGGFTHNSWPDATGHWLYVTDEVNGEPLKVFDISSLAAPSLVNAITSNPQAIVHNAHVKGNVLFLANYTEGIRALDLSDPAHPAEFAWADSYAGPSGGFAGVWEVAPFFPSGTVVASDRNSGLYVYRLQADYGILRAKVVDGAGDPFPGVEVHLTTLGDSLTTPADGIVQFGPGPGVHTVLAHRFGYHEASATRTVSLGSRDTVTLELLPKPTALFTGVVRDHATAAALDEAEVSLSYTDVHQHTGPSGLYSLTIPDDIYRLEVRRGGYLPLVIERRIGPGFPGVDYSLIAAPVWDPLETASGWTVGAAGDNATGGIWTRVVPNGTGPRPPYEPPPGATSVTGGSRTVRPKPGAPSVLAGRRDRDPAMPMHEVEPSVTGPNLAPYYDHTAGTGTMCFVTENGTDTVMVHLADVDAGKTTLTTPALDLTGMSEPTIGYWRWFASFWPIGTSSGHNGPDPADYLAVLISNDDGATWTAVDTVRGLENHWTEDALRVEDYVTPTAQVKLRFVAADIGTDTGCEAGIDDLIAYDAAMTTVSVVPGPRAARLAFRAPRPNPASGSVSLVLEIPAAGEATVEVVDLVGRRVRTLHRGAVAAGPLALAWDGRDAGGRESSAGLYFARAIVAGAQAEARFARIR